MHLIIKYMGEEELKHLMKRLNRKQFQTPHVNELILYYKQLLAVLTQPNLTTLMKVHVQKMVKITLALLSVIQLK